MRADDQCRRIGIAGDEIIAGHRCRPDTAVQQTACFQSASVFNRLLFSIG
jgi:hypothetical protein